jgi:hypothetical protein
MLLREVADWLQAAGYTVDFVAARQNYREGQQKGGRMRREALALARMLWDGLRRPRPDVVLSATSPPCLLLVATVVALWHRAKSVHWVMDLYPEIAVALGEIRPGVLSGLLAKLMGWGYRCARHVVVVDEDMGARIRAYGVSSEIVEPWVFAPIIEHVRQATAEPEVPWTWIYSGNLGRAHEWETLLTAQAILEQRAAGIRLVFQGGGPARLAAEAKATALGLKECLWRGYADEAELPNVLRRAQVLSVTQVTAAKGLLWPSKLALARCLARPILWIGPTDGAIARELRTLPQAGIFAPGEAKAVADWLMALKAQPGASKLPPIDPAIARENALENWLRLLEALDHR